MKKTWFSAAEIAAEALPEMPASKRGVARLAEVSKWDRGETARQRQGRGGGLEYHFSLLPGGAQAALVARYADDEGTPVQKCTAAALPALQAPRGAESWAWYETLPSSLKDRALQRLDALTRVETLRRRVGRGRAIKAVAEEAGVTVASVHNWLDRVRGVARCDWLPALVPAPRGGGGRPVEIDERFLDAFKADYLRLSEPSVTSCYRRCERLAKKEGWAVPNLRTLRRRIEDIPPAALVLARKGRQATKELFPAQERDRSGFHALQAVNADGHKWDVFVRWPDGKVSRPISVAWQDLYSNLFLAWRFGRTENKDEVRLTFGDMIEKYGIPDDAWMDNGLAFGNKQMTGGVAHRFRFRVKAEEPDGIMKQFGVQVHWTTPYAGQSKPIERGFGDFARDIAKHPAFQGAYCGNSPMAKPEDYGSRAIPVEEFIAIVTAEIHAHNTRTGRRTRVCGGVKSFQQAFDESYAKSLIRKATAEQRRLCMLAVENVKVRKDGAIYLLENRYWHERLLEHRGRLVTARFDPENVHQDLGVYAADGTLICLAQLIETTGFADTEAARTHNQARNAFLRATKERMEAERVLSLRELVALQPKTEALEPPEPKIIRPMFGNLAVKMAEDAEDAEEETEIFYENFARGLRLVPDARGET